MKQGRTITQIQELVTDIKRNQEDYIVPVSSFSNMAAEIASVAPSQIMGVEDVIRQTEAAMATGATSQIAAGSLAIGIQREEKHVFAPTGYANGQIGAYAEIPAAYYSRLLQENRPLLAQCINHGFTMAATRATAKAANTGRMLRTYKGQLRAFLSSRYRRLDNFDLLEAVSPSLIRLGFEPISCELTETRLYIKVVSPRVQGEIGVGDVVQYGLVISGSDVGAGMVKVEPMVYRLRCSNGMITEAAIKQAHIGRNQAGEEIEHLLTDETKQLSDLAFWHQVRDVVEGMARPEVFQAEIDKIKAAEGQTISQYNLPILVQRTAREIGGINLTERMRAVIVDNLGQGAHGAGGNKWGLANAFTFAAHAVPELDYDTATDLERAGSKIVSLTERSWGYINRKIDRHELKEGSLANA